MSTTINLDDHQSYANFAQLYAAIQRNHTEKIIQLIVEKQIDINYRIPASEFLELHEPELIGCTALHLALSEDRFECFELLLNYYADFNIQNQKQMSVVCQAIEKSFNKREIVKLRCLKGEYGRDLDIYGENSLLAMLRVIEGESFYKHDNWRLWSKFEDKYVNSILSACLKTKNILKCCNNDGESLFHAACLTNNIEAVDFFIKNGADLCQSSSLKIFSGFTPLHFAVRYSGVEILKALLDNKANLFTRDHKFMSPIDVLVDQNLRIIEWLHAKNHLPYGNSILDYRENEEKLNLIIKSNNKADCTRFSGFHVALILTNVSSIRITCSSRGPLALDKFLEGDDWRVYDHISPPRSTVCPWSGYTALHFAAFFNIDTAKLLINSGADVEAENIYGVTSLDILETRATLDDLYFIVNHKESWKCITLSDRKTTLLHLISSMKSLSTFNNFLREIEINLSIPDDAPLWSGYTILHLVVTFSETVKKVRFMKNTADSDGSNLSIEYENCCEEQGKSYRDKIELCLSKNADVTIQDTRGRTPVNLAFRQREMEAVNLMLQHHDNDVNPTDDDNLSHLHIACVANNHALVEKLLLNGADVNAAIKSTFQWHCDYHRCISTDVFDLIGSTPLHLSVISGHLNLIKLLLKNGADVNAKDAVGRTPLHRIFFLQNVWEIAHKFFKTPRFTRLMSRRGPLIYEPCYVTAWKRFENITDELLSSPLLRESIVDSLGLSHLHVAVSENNVEAAKKLLDLGSDINAVIRCSTKKLGANHSLLVFSRYDGYTPLHICRDSFAPDTEKLLLERGADFLTQRAGGMNRLFDKPPTRMREHVKFIIDALTEYEALRRRLQYEFGWTVLHVACLLVNFELANFAFSIGVDVNSRTNDDSPIHPGSTALHILIMNCQKTEASDGLKSYFGDILSSLLDNGADVMLTDLRGNTPLHQSDLRITYDSRYFYAESTYLGRLLERVKNYSFNPINYRGMSVFHIACIRHDIAAVTKFLDHGVDVNQPIELISRQTTYQYPSGSTPLHLAVAWRSELRDDYELQLETISLLLKRGADVNAKDKRGDTPLHIISKSSSPRQAIFDILIRYGADINTKNVYDETPLELLLTSKKITPQELEFFLKRGCRMNIFNETTQVYYLSLIFGLRMCNGKPMENDVIKVALSCSSIIEVDCKGRTAIHNLMVSKNNRDLNCDDVFRYFMERGCDIDSQDESGMTALHLASQFRNSSGVEVLLMNGADVNLIDSNGKTAFAYNLECKFLTKIIYHMRLRGLYVNNVNEKALIGTFSEFSNNQNRIDEEYNDLKNVKIGDTAFTIEDFLSETNAIVYFSKITPKDRKVIVQFFMTTIRECQFRNWRFLCVLQYKKALQRVELVERMKNVINIVIKFPLPDLCFEVLQKFLSNADLKNFYIAMTQ